jgi:hypothetical protein
MKWATLILSQVQEIWVESIQVLTKESQVSQEVILPLKEFMAREGLFNSHLSSNLTDKKTRVSPVCIKGTFLM